MAIHCHRAVGHNHYHHPRAFSPFSNATTSSTDGSVVEIASFTSSNIDTSASITLSSTVSSTLTWLTTSAPSTAGDGPFVTPTASLLPPAQSDDPIKGPVKEAGDRSWRGVVVAGCVLCVAVLVCGYAWWAIRRKERTMREKRARKGIEGSKTKEMVMQNSEEGIVGVTKDGKGGDGEGNPGGVVDGENGRGGRSGSLSSEGEIKDEARVLRMMKGEGK
ncbi:hypothetical protein CAC42_4931 [Sphaceloma murrayae]|uniref:Uncharacterized protein n=1 Tax=Sphaceloma murrayae TaxID=2082308 RepID=A0A2K1QPE1_9PEZI|nr:hypothetical protein CAC42_4931 [Sphaceloma murrayae]